MDNLRYYVGLLRWFLDSDGFRPENLKGVSVGLCDESIVTDSSHGSYPRHRVIDPPDYQVTFTFRLNNDQYIALAQKLAQLEKGD